MVTSKTETVRARIELGLKHKEENVFHKLGLTRTHAITIFYRQAILCKGLPFDVVIPNETTKKIFENTDSGRDIVICKNADDMFQKLGL